MTWLDKILPLVGVIIGAMLTPWIAFKMEKTRRKLSLKPELVQITYIFFNLWKLNISIHNNAEFQKRYAYLVSELLSSPNIDISQKELKSRDFDTLMKDIFILQDNAKVNFEKMMEIEAKLLSMTTEFQKYYGEIVYIKLSNLIRPLVDESNNTSALHNYFEFSADEINRIKKELPKEIDKKAKEIDAKCNKVVNMILSI